MKVADCGCPDPERMKTGFTGHQPECPIEQSLRRKFQQQAESIGAVHIDYTQVRGIRGGCPYVCPVCGGSTLVRATMYDQGLPEEKTKAGKVPCRSCNATGVVWG